MTGSTRRRGSAQTGANVPLARRVVQAAVAKIRSVSGSEHARLVPGTDEYEHHVRGELEHYERIFDTEEGRRTLQQPVPGAWHEMERRASELIRSSTGAVPTEHVVSRLQGEAPRLLSLGSGPAGVEIAIAQRVPNARVTCVDLNAGLLALGRERAEALALQMDFVEADLNVIDLPQGEYDVVWAHAALHHVVELERLAAQIHNALKPGGRLIVVDVISRNGYRMWPESRSIARSLFGALPARLRLNHTAYGEPAVDSELWEADTSAHSMECVRSEDIERAFEAVLALETRVGYFSLCRRFFDTMYGPNYDLAAQPDAAIVEGIWQLDQHYLRSGVLRPETYFAIYRRR